MNFLLKQILKIFFICGLIFSFANQVLAQPIPITTDSRIKTLVYNPNEVFELKFYYGYQSFIEFADNEEIEMISIGEAFAWRITPSGKRLFIRPLEIAAHTNMTIITSKRTYHFDIKSGEYDGKADEELVYTVRFYYPQIGQPLPIPPQLALATSPKIGSNKKMIRTATPGGDITQSPTDANILAINGNPTNAELHFDYSLAGKSENIVPIKVYDNGSETYMQFADNNLTIPTISFVDDFGAEHQLEYVVRDNFVVLPVVEKQFTLRLGEGLLCVFNNNLLYR